MPDYNWADPAPGEKVAIDAEVEASAGADVAAAEAATEAAELAAANTYDNGNSGASKTISFANGPHQKLTLTASAPTVTVAGLASGTYAEMALELVQDGTGSRLLPTFSPAADWGTVGAPTLSTVAGKIDVVKLTSFDGVVLQAVLVEKGV